MSCPRGQMSFVRSFPLTKFLCAKRAGDSSSIHHVNFKMHTSRDESTPFRRQAENKLNKIHSLIVPQNRYFAVKLVTSLIASIYAMKHYGYFPRIMDIKPYNPSWPLLGPLSAPLGALASRRLIVPPVAILYSRYYPIFLLSSTN